MTSPVSAIEAIERFERAVRANGYRTSDDQTEAECQAAKAVVLAFARKAEAYERRAEAAEALAERLKLEAKIHAGEARTANSTIYEIYQVVSGRKGEPGNWHGAKPVRAKLEAYEREIAELREALKPFAECCPEWDGEPDSLHVFFEWNDECAPVPSLPVADFRRARSLTKEQDNAE